MGRSGSQAEDERFVTQDELPRLHLQTGRCFILHIGSGQPGAGTGEGTGPDAGGTGEGGSGEGAPPRGTIDLQVVSTRGVRQQRLEVELTLPDGGKRAGRTDRDGRFLAELLPAEGSCALEIPDVTAPDEAAPPAGEGRLRYRKGLELAVDSKPVIELPPQTRRCKLTGMHFETNKTFLRPSSMAGIRQLRSLYESYGAMALLVTGHTDTVGDAGYNRGLSEERAQAIAAFLTDDVEAWYANYAPPAHSGVWGVREDQYMLATLPQGQPPYYADTVDGAAGSNTQAAWRRFQADKGLPQTSRADEASRRALIADYMALDGTSLPAGSTVLTHGCGLTHLAQPTGPGVACEENRRVELFLFDAEVAPPPQTPCPAGGCAEYPQWVAQSAITVDLDQPAGTLTVTVQDDDGGAPLDGAEVHLAGPVPQDQVTAGGAATFEALVPGHYEAIADLQGYAASDGEAEVASGAASAVLLQLKKLPPMEIVWFQGRAVTAEEYEAWKRERGAEAG